MTTTYELRYKPQGGAENTWSAWIDAGTGTQHTLTELDAGTEYEVEVRAVRNGLTSTNNPTGRRWTRFAAPSAPTVGTVLAETATLTWPAVAGAAGYRVLRDGVAVAAGDVAFSESGGVVTATVSGLTAASTQTFSVAVLNGNSDVSAATAAPAATTTPALATGGTVSTFTDGGTTYRVHTFTSTGDSTFTLNATRDVEYLIVGGGGGGGTRHGGGGGGGGMLTGTASAQAPGSYTITVGAGGVGMVDPVLASPDGSERDGANGGNSSAFGLTAIGGGRGGGARHASSVGGSGGGSPFWGALGSAGTTDQGSAGGRGTGENNSEEKEWGGGGGGGASAAGAGALWDNSTSKNTSGGAGGAGRSSSITGTAVVYAGGGGGGISSLSSGSAGAGGTGGGGAGGKGSGQNGTNGTDGRGGGGGGGGFTQSNNAAGGNGGNGVVIVRYTV